MGGRIAPIVANEHGAGKGAESASVSGLAATAATSHRTGLVAFLVGSCGMFATMYSTQAILPALGRTFDVGPARAGLSVSVVVLAIAIGVWIWGPLSDRLGRRRTMITASALLVVPTVAAGMAPTFTALLACRALQGLCMPGLLAVGVPYVMEAFGGWLGGRAMGIYVAALVAGGLIGRIGVALVADVSGWRWGVGGLAILPAAGALLMARALPDTGAPARSGARGGGVLAQVRNRPLLGIAVAAGCLFFTFVGVFSYVVYRLQERPFELGAVASSLVFSLWLLGAVGPPAGRLADRLGWRRTALGAVGCMAVGLLLSLPAWLPTLVLALGLVTTAMFAGVTALQLGVTEVATADRGAASAVYFSIYYACGAVGAFAPGLAWQAWGWSGVAAVALAAVCTAAALLGSAALASARRRAHAAPPGAPRPDRSPVGEP
jgi:MFS transporter, YNFM family, putative membrane transport protein